ncbi:MAG: antibiotic biosynthesis monooxygenase family protein [bacterium]
MIRVVVRPAKRMEFLQAIQKILDGSRMWPGCGKGVLCHVLEDENDFHLMQEWDSRPELDAYLGSKDFHALLGAMKVLGEAREVRIFSNGTSKEKKPVRKPQGEMPLPKGIS